jgi:DNA-binding ferritin-like protein
VIIEMMDHERTEKELQEIFEEIQHSYNTFMEDVLALQERTFGFARELLENSADPEAEGMWATLEELVDKSKAQRERFERLARKSSEAYMKVLEKPIEEHHHKIKEAKADLEEANPS